MSLLERLVASGEDVNAQDEAGSTPLHFAAQQMSMEAAALLIDNGADVNLVDMHGNGPLWTAVFNSGGSGSMIELLRVSGADPFRSNAHGTTPLALARLIANYDVRQYFSDLP